MKWVATLVETTFRNMESRQSAKLPTWQGQRGQREDHLFAVCKTTYMTRAKGSERRPFIFIFRLNILHDSYQVDEIVMEIEEWKYKKF